MLPRFPLPPEYLHGVRWRRDARHAAKLSPVVATHGKQLATTDRLAPVLRGQSVAKRGPADENVVHPSRVLGRRVRLVVKQAVQLLERRPVVLATVAPALL